MKFFVSCLSILFLLFSCAGDDSRIPLFKHYTVSVDIPEYEETVRYGTPALGDFDNDGDIDFAMTVTRKDLLWFEFQGNHLWKMHKAGVIPTAQLGGGAYDVDKDGWIDIVVGGYWYRNPGDPVNRPFDRIPYDSAIDREIHDLVFEDINGDHLPDLVVLGDKEGLFWYEIPADPVHDSLWIKHTITLDVLDDNADIHGGFFPGGIGDLDNDGDNDIVLPNRWYRNEQSGVRWTRQFLPFGSGGYWGLSGRSWIVDLDRDGDNDIVMVGCDQKDSRGAWLENQGNEYPQFLVHLLPLSASGRRGSFHSLWVADFDQDDDWDIYTMDQEDHLILPQGTGIKGYLWENIDGKGQEFREKVVIDKNIGGHDCQFADVDGDGDLDAYFKVWAPLESNAYGGKPHVDYLENLTIRN
jgi:hypothetical protein